MRRRNGADARFPFRSVRGLDLAVSAGNKRLPRRPNGLPAESRVGRRAQVLTSNEGASNHAESCGLPTAVLEFAQQMSHAGHDHGQSGSSAAGQRNRLIIAFGLSTLYMAAEVIGGLLSNSLALLADAGHMLADSAALGISLFAIWVASRPATARRTFGYHRAEILAALVNAATLIAVAGGILIEAWHRLRDPAAVQSTVMLAIAIGGLVVNLMMLAVLHGGREENLNLRGAWLHVLSDALGSVAVLVAAFFIRWQGWMWVDPVASAVISLLVLHAAWRLLAAAVSVLMESAPASIAVEDVRNCLLSVPGVRDVHCLHVWTISSGLNSLSAHVAVDSGHQGPQVLQVLRNAIADRFDVGHVTLQIEPDEFSACRETEIPEHQLPGAACRPGAEPVQATDDSGVQC